MCQMHKLYKNRVHITMHRLQTNITVHTMKHKIKITNGEIKYKVSVHNADRLVFRAVCNKNLI